MAGLNSAWVLLKNRGQELDLPPPRESSESIHHRYLDYPTAGLSPQDITDRRVDARNERNNLESEHELSLRDLAGSGEYQSELRDGMRDAKETEEAYEHAQRRLDQQTMTREGQQGEADEMDAMGVPEMSRTLSERPRMPPVGPDDLHPDDLDEMSDEEVGAYTDEVEARGPFNPFPQRTMKSLDAAWSHLRKALY